MLAENQSSQETSTENFNVLDIELPYCKTESSVEKVDDFDLHVELREHVAIKRQFKIEMRAQVIDLMLYRMMENIKIPIQLSNKPLHRIFNEIIEELAMSELEISLWAIFLDDFVWSQISPTQTNWLIFAAFYAKAYLNDDIKPFEAYMSQNIESFRRQYNEWVSMFMDRLKSSPTRINLKYKELCKIVDPKNDFPVLNYNFYVDKILRHSCPYLDRQEKQTSDKFDVPKPVSKFRRRSRKSRAKRIAYIQRKVDTIAKMYSENDTISHFDTVKSNFDRKMNEIQRKVDAIAEDHSRYEYSKHIDANFDKIDKFCAGLLSYDDLNPEEYYF